ncbi:MAG: response regulator transcription factor [Nevskiales bacterium]
MDPFDDFVARLYRGSAFIKANHFREWALLQLRELIPFDAALWGSGSVETTKFHTLTLLGVSEDYPRTLEKTSVVNPVWEALLTHPEEPIDSAQLMPDKEFYRTEIYRRCFSKFKIERLLATLHNEPRSGLVTLISVYRSNRRHLFTAEERSLQKRAIRHLVNAASHAFFTHLIRTAPEAYAPAALCDREGYLYEVQPQFLDLMEEHFFGWRGPRLPFALPVAGNNFSHYGICGNTTALNDLVCVQIWQEGPLDLLTDREQQVVQDVGRGLSFKDIARNTGIAPSTVSNHLYRIYRKLGIKNRSSLAKLLEPQRRDLLRSAARKPVRAKGKAAAPR